MLICSTNAGSSENRSLLKELYDKYGRTVLGICYDILRSKRGLDPILIEKAVEN